VPKRSLEDLVGQAVAGDGGGVVTTVELGLDPDTNGGAAPTGEVASLDTRTPVVPKSRTSALPQVATTGPRYLRLARKDVRLREDQIEALDAAARRLSRNRVDKSERITPNTLVRLAVDLLIPRLDGLEGDTEEALLQSLQGRV